MNKIEVISYDNAIEDLKKSIEGLKFQITGNYIRVEFDCTLDNSVLKEQLNNKDEIKINDELSVKIDGNFHKSCVYIKIIRSDEKVFDSADTSLLRKISDPTDPIHLTYKNILDSTHTIISEEGVLDTIKSKFKEHYLNTKNHNEDIIYSQLIKHIKNQTREDVYDIESYIDKLDNEDKYKILKYLDESNLGKKELSDDDFESFVKIIKKLNNNQYNNFLNEIHKNLKEKILKVKVS